MKNACFVQEDGESKLFYKLFRRFRDEGIGGLAEVESGAARLKLSAPAKPAPAARKGFESPAPQALWGWCRQLPSIAPWGSRVLASFFEEQELKLMNWVPSSFCYGRVEELRT